MAVLKLKGRMKSLLLFLPNMIALCGRLMTDRRVPRAEKALFAGAIVYAIMPIDFIPDVLPFVGQMDDAYLIALTLLRLLNRTDERIVREHWRGAGDVVQLAESIAGLAPMLLPRRIRQVLSSRVEVAPVDKQAALRDPRMPSMRLIALPDEEERERPGRQTGAA